MSVCLSDWFCLSDGFVRLSVCVQIMRSSRLHVEISVTAKSDEVRKKYLKKILPLNI